MIIGVPDKEPQEVSWLAWYDNTQAGNIKDKLWKKPIGRKENYCIHCRQRILIKTIAHTQICHELFQAPKQLLSGPYLNGKLILVGTSYTLEGRYTCWDVISCVKLNIIVNSFLRSSIFCWLIETGNSCRHPTVCHTECLKPNTFLPVVLEAKTRHKPFYLWGSLLAVKEVLKLGL